VVSTRDVVGPAEVLDAAGDHAFARFVVDMAPPASVRGLRGNGAVLWRGDTAHGPLGHGMGEPAAVLGLLDAAVHTGLVDGLRWVNLPRLAPHALPVGWVHNGDWDFRWTTARPAVQPGQDRVVPLSDLDAAAVNGLLDAASLKTLRPGHALVRRFYGVWQGDELVACAADRSSPGVGVISSVAVHPGHRRSGLGAAISAALTEALVRRYGLVTLGVTAGNDAATRIYERLGYRDVVPITSVHRPSG
jgi:ribosomal protein S18 acetylase RimI-like enzyme